MRTILRAVYDLLFPQLCVVCGNTLLRSEKCICSNCIVELPQTRNYMSDDNYTSQIFWGRVPFIRAASLFYYHKTSPFKQCLYKLKYQNRPDVGQYLGSMLGHELETKGFMTDIDFLIPMPLHKRRLHERGYNQSLEICTGIHAICKIPINTQAIKRSKYTETQTHRSKQERLENVADAFSLSETTQLQNKHVLLIDDVITTGASVEACCTLLLQIPGIKISIASLAVTKN